MSFTIPNLLTLLRMGLVPPFVVFLINGEAKKALLIVLAAGVTDALDGFIARFFNQRSALGALLDPLADKLLVDSAYVVLAIPTIHHGFQIPLWVTVLVIARDVLLVVVATALYLAHGIRNFPVTLLSKITTVFQFSAIVLVLLTALRPELETAAIVVLYTMAALTLASGLDYIYRTNRRIEDRPRPTAAS
jgi:cardiolipin synthase (CMP-forming)